jgi:ketosteroid isomerase-like protein
MTPNETVAEVWRRIASRDWDGFGALLAPDVVLELPASRERVTGRANVIAVNAEYPDGWSIDVRRIVGGDEAAVAGTAVVVVSEVNMPLADVGVFAAASFWTVVDGRVTRLREYWVLIGGDEAPEWRRPYAERLSD